jgi:TatA/E family protein of Tat protein translocase
MFGLGIGEIVLIAIIAIVLFGKEDLPKNLRKVAKGVNEFKKVASDAQRSWMEVKDDVTRTIMHADLEQDIRNSGTVSRKALGGEGHADGHAVDKQSEVHGVVGDSVTLSLPDVVPAVGVVPRGQEIVGDDHSHHHHEERREESQNSFSATPKSTT